MDHHVQAVLDQGALSYFPALLQHPRKKINRKAISCLSNITAGNQQRVQTVINANLLPLVIMRLETGDFQTQKKAARAIRNLTISGSQDQIRYCVQNGVIPPLCKLLGYEELQITTVVLDSI